FACGLDWDRTTPARLSVLLSGAAAPATQLITPVLRQYDVQHVNGLPPKTVSPPPADLERIKEEHARLAAARKADTAQTWFSEPFDWPAPGIMSGVFG